MKYLLSIWQKSLEALQGAQSDIFRKTVVNNEHTRKTHFTVVETGTKVGTRPFYPGHCSVCLD